MLRFESRTWTNDLVLSVTEGLNSGIFAIAVEGDSELLAGVAQSTAVEDVITVGKRRHFGVRVKLVSNSSEIVFWVGEIVTWGHSGLKYSVDPPAIPILPKPLHTFVCNGRHACRVRVRSILPGFGVHTLGSHLHRIGDTTGGIHLTGRPITPERCSLNADSRSLSRALMPIL